MKRIILTFTLFGCIEHQAMALPDKCVALSDKTEACPHLIYKQAPINLPTLDINAGQVICVCLSDFSDITKTPSTDVEKISQRMALQQASLKLDITPDELNRLLSYRP